MTTSVLAAISNFKNELQKLEDALRKTGETGEIWETRDTGDTGNTGDTGKRRTLGPQG